MFSDPLSDIAITIPQPHLFSGQSAELPLMHLINQLVTSSIINLSWFIIKASVPVLLHHCSWACNGRLLIANNMSPGVCLSFLVAFFSVQVNAHTHGELSEQYTYSVEMDTEGRYTMFYSYDEASSILRIAVRVQTTGWIGLGISPNGQMPGSDVVMGWVDQNGTAFLQVKNGARSVHHDRTKRFDWQ